MPGETVPGICGSCISMVIYGYVELHRWCNQCFRCWTIYQLLVCSIWSILRILNWHRLVETGFRPRWESDSNILNQLRRQPQSTHMPFNARYPLPPSSPPPRPYSLVQLVDATNYPSISGHQPYSLTVNRQTEKLSYYSNDLSGPYSIGDHISISPWIPVLLQDTPRLVEEGS